jgi:hypothetical protein
LANCGRPEDPAGEENSLQQRKFTAEELEVEGVDEIHGGRVKKPQRRGDPQFVFRWSNEEENCAHSGSLGFDLSKFVPTAVSVRGSSFERGRDSMRSIKKQLFNSQDKLIQKSHRSWSGVMWD